MNFINLMPHRQRRAALRRQRFIVMLSVSVVAAAVLAVLAALWLQFALESQEQRNRALQQETESLRRQESAVRSLQDDIAQLKARQATVEALQSQRNGPVALASDLARLTPNGVSLTGVRQFDAGITVTGLAQSNERVSEFVSQLQTQSLYLDQVELVEVRLAPPLSRGPVSRSARSEGGQPERFYEFTLQLRLKTSAVLKGEAK